MIPTQENHQTKMAGVKIRGIQYLRALAAIMIVIYHAGGSIASAKYQGNESIGNFTRGLDSGVDLFFVISGFVIALPLLSGSSPGAAHFLCSRLFRIYPMAALTTLIFIVGGTLAQAKLPENLVATALTSALLLPSPYEPLPIVLWTLKQELLFYFLFTTAVVQRKAGIALIILWATTSFSLGGAQGWILAWLFHVKNIEFLLGIGICALYARTKLTQKASVTLAILAASIFFYISTHSPSLGMGNRVDTLLLGSSSALLVYAMACLRVPDVKVISFLGLSSYSIYLIHFVFVSLANKILVHTPTTDFISFVLVCTSGVTGGAFYYLVAERPLETLRKGITAVSLRI